MVVIFKYSPETIFYLVIAGRVLCNGCQSMQDKRYLLNHLKMIPILSYYFLPKSAGISPQEAVSHLSTGFSQVFFFNQFSAR